MRKLYHTVMINLWAIFTWPSIYQEGMFKSRKLFLFGLKQWAKHSYWFYKNSIDYTYWRKK